MRQHLDLVKGQILLGVEVRDHLRAVLASRRDIRKGRDHALALRFGRLHGQGILNRYRTPRVARNVIGSVPT
ncbi:MAG: hypothetical protein AAFN74_12585, partial [Myxococcota bacterium]